MINTSVPSSNATTPYPNPHLFTFDPLSHLSSTSESASDNKTAARNQWQRFDSP